MNLLVCALFVVIFLIEFVVDSGIVSRYAILLPELLTGIAVLVICVKLLNGKKVALSSKYLVALAVLGLVMLVGIVAQSVAPGPIVAGMRSYLKYLPFFFLPAVYNFSDRQLKVQFSVLAVLIVIQSPLSVYQRFIEYASRMHTGDYITGTVSTSGSLSLLVIGAIAMIMVLYLRRKIGIVAMAIGSAIVFVPAMINETKVTLVLLPVVLLAPMFFMPNRRDVLRKFLPIAAIGCAAVIVFIGIYDYLSTFSNYGRPISEYVTGEATTFYLYTGASSIDEYGYIGRVDSLILAYKNATQDPFRFVFGLGIGNVSDSIVSSFSGEYAQYGVRFGAKLTQIGHFVWEVGFAGLVIYLLIFLMVYRDARWLANGTGFIAVIGQFWSTVMLVVVFGLIYIHIFDLDEIGYLFWFFSGVVASKRYRLSRENKTDMASPASRSYRHPDRSPRIISSVQ